MSKELEQIANAKYTSEALSIITANEANIIIVNCTVDSKVVPVVCNLVNGELTPLLLGITKDQLSQITSSEITL